MQVSHPLWLLPLSLLLLSSYRSLLRLLSKSLSGLHRSSGSSLSSQEADLPLPSIRLCCCSPLLCQLPYSWLWSPVLHPPWLLPLSLLPLSSYRLLRRLL